MSCLKTWDIGCNKKGDTFKAILFEIPFSIVGCSFLMQFKKAKIGINDNEVAFQWSTSDGTFIITDGVNGKLQMNKQIINVDVDNYISDLQMTKPNGDIQTLFNAKIQIVEDYSR
jgi:hypothetical protein